MSATGLLERALEVPLGGLFRVELGGGRVEGYPPEVLALVEVCHDGCIFQAVGRGAGAIRLEGAADVEVRVGEERPCPPLRALDLCL